LAGEEGFEPSHAGIKIRCLNQLGDSPKKPSKRLLTHVNLRNYTTDAAIIPMLQNQNIASVLNLALAELHFDDETLQIPKNLNRSFLLLKTDSTK